MSTILPEHLLKLTTPEVRASLGKARYEKRFFKLVGKATPRAEMP